MLAVSDVDVHYGRSQVLFGVGLDVPAGSLVCVLGRNGVGKTTLLKTVVGLLRPTSGTVLLDGVDVTRTPVHRRVRAGLAYVPQGHVVFPQLTVAENLRVVAEARPGKDAGAVDDALSVFPALVPLLRRRAGLLSGGQRQQLAIARALVARPRLLVLDEPTEGVQPSVVDEIEAAVRRLHREVGLTVLLVEQHVDLAARLADRFALLDAGEVVRSGDAAELRGEEVRRLLSV
ncbi:urea ABC transporter ATP-binding subunit UrtE [Actinosynnema mirum]|uniref:Urea ABC transporter, ATP-binding protein UrtE n=1 Tax=Actinosynnema mirum (strain ATCC 29888 / DSM 43827 / JCM 3225 / NBRC 14064 / NCIMB 13271 / NRRL B-12336 / IMRU 3971 / 101) TaxID=446462 RepID=C6WBQ1_ACTMD|nr:urea ABC transporter ATP-binding subunit UrtE [Actinosynnema mirum]ACU35619.1 urea ABC transporter, ATP-binding protein UrtE [Actinosynnema mirum DSM 43827]